jgi:hypothetical protein
LPACRKPRTDFFDKQEQMCLEGEGEGEGLTSPTCIRSV